MRPKTILNHAPASEETWTGLMFGIWFSKIWQSSRNDSLLSDNCLNSLQCSPGFKKKKKTKYQLYWRKTTQILRMNNLKNATRGSSCVLFKPMPLMHELHLHNCYSCHVFLYNLRQKNACLIWFHKRLVAISMHSIFFWELDCKHGARPNRLSTYSLIATFYPMKSNTFQCQLWYNCVSFNLCCTINTQLFTY